jgi:hypothetical protein
VVQTRVIQQGGTMKVAQSLSNTVDIVRSWKEANGLVEAITHGQHTLGYGYRYQKSYAVLPLDNGAYGYRVFRCADGQLDRLERVIRLH